MTWTHIFNNLVQKAILIKRKEKTGSKLKYDWFPRANWITLNKMNKDYHNKFAPDIWCLFRGIVPCILIFLFLFKDGYYNFQFSQNQVKKIWRPELCTHVTFIHRILLILFVVMVVCTFNRGRREFVIDCRTDSRNSGKGWEYLDRVKRRGARRSDNGCIGRLLD